MCAAKTPFGPGAGMANGETMLTATDPVRVYSAMMEGAGDFGREVAKFVSDRISEDLQVQQEILQCRNPAELVQVHQRFLERAFTRYADETGRMMQIGADIMHVAMAGGNSWPGVNGAATRPARPGNGKPEETGDK